MSELKKAKAANDGRPKLPQSATGVKTMAGIARKSIPSGNFFSSSTRLQTNAAALVQSVLKHAAPQLQRMPVAPPPYRPQPTPIVLQRKIHVASRKADRAQASWPKKSYDERKPAANKKSIEQSFATLAYAGGRRRATVQRFTSRVIQAVKFYPNLHPGAVEPVDPSNIFKLESFANQYRLHKTQSHGINVPNQQYNFVRTREGEMLLHSRYRHPSIAEGKQVMYAGEIFFNNGQLQWWSNGSGHYQPYVEDAAQANLPMDSFYSYQQIIKGEHTRKKG